MARTPFSGGIAICIAGLLFGATVAAAGDVFTGYQIDNQGEYYTYLVVRTTITSGK